MTYRLLNDGKMGKNLNDNFITSTKTVFVFLFFFILKYEKSLTKDKGLGSFSVPINSKMDK